MDIEEEEEQTVPLINEDSCGDGGPTSGIIKKQVGFRENIILNSISLSMIFMITRYYYFYLNEWSVNFNINQTMFYSLYSIPFCFFAPIIISKLRVKYTIFIVMVLLFILYLCVVYLGVRAIAVSLVLTPILNELLYISIGSYLISFSKNLNIVGLTFGIFTGIPMKNINSINIGNIQFDDFTIQVKFLILTLSMVLVFSLGRDGSASNCNNENVEKSNGLFTIMSVLGSKKFIYFIPAAIYIGMGYDYSTIVTNFETNYKFQSGFFFIPGIIGGISAIVFGVLSDKLNNKSLLMKISLIFSLISIILNSIAFETKTTTSSYRVDNTYIVINEILTCFLIVFIYSIGSIYFNNNSLSFVASIRLLKAVGSTIGDAKNIFSDSQYSVPIYRFYNYFQSFTFVIGISLIILISKRINSNNHVYSQIV